VFYLSECRLVTAGIGGTVGEQEALGFPVVRPATNFRFCHLALPQGLGCALFGMSQALTGKGKCATIRAVEELQGVPMCASARTRCCFRIQRGPSSAECRSA
jgi:hypothetical protein